MTKYRIADPVPEKVKNLLNNYSPVLQQLLYRQDITTMQSAEDFLHPSFENDLHDPFLLHDMEEAVERILLAIKTDEKIAIFSDYDCDGIPGAVVLHDFFKKIGYDNFINYIPHRHYEGFGFSKYAVDKLSDKNIQLIITIDCGTTAIDAVEFSKEKGIDVIITDHHLPLLCKNKKEKLPSAVAVVNPQLGDTYPFKGLCGAGVVFKLVQALISKGSETKQFDWKEGQEKWLLDMVGVATIADMVPLVGENRALAHYGLLVLRKSRRPGLQQLLRKQKINPRFLSEDDIGFTIGPRINASSRMDNPEDAFLMLTSTDESDASERVDHLEKLNNERRGLVASMTKDAHKRMKLMAEVPDVLVMGDSNWRPSLVGLVASKLAEEYNRPAFLWGKDGHGVIKGSCRSDGNVSIVQLMDSVPELLLESGGHHMAGGFSVKEDLIHTLSKMLNQAYASLGDDVFLDKKLTVDASIGLQDIDYAFLKNQQQCSPFGVDNPKPLYELKGINISDISLFGKTKEHTKLLFKTEGIAKEAIAFFKLPDNFSVLPEVGKKHTLLAHLEQSYFMGRQQTRLRIVDIV